MSTMTTIVSDTVKRIQMSGEILFMVSFMFFNSHSKQCSIADTSDMGLKIAVGFDIIARLLYSPNSWLLPVFSIQWS